MRRAKAEFREVSMSFGLFVRGIRRERLESSEWSGVVLCSEGFYPSLRSEDSAFEGAGQEGRAQSRF